MKKSCLMPIKRSALGSIPPLFCVHGEPLLITQELKAERSVYALNCIYEANSIEDAPVEIEVLASRYISEIKKVQPSGPYFLYGFCTGAMVAYEMALQLTKNGDLVRHLLLSCPSVGSPRSLETAKTIIIALGSNGFSMMRLKNVLKIIARIFRHLPGFIAMQLKILRYKLMGRMPPELMMELHLLRLRPARQKYRYKPINCKIEVIDGQLNKEQLARSAKAWSDIAGVAVKTYTVSEADGHMDLLQLPIAAKRTAELIDRAVI